MFNYGGSKYWLAGAYPPPAHDTIVEPFAGSAQYACRYWDRRVILIERSERIVAIWRYMHRATPEEIMALPHFEPGEEVIHPVPEARDLIALGCNHGTSIPQRVAGRFNQWPSKRRKIAENLDRIRHWDVRCWDYTDAPDVDATWFVDPPYANLRTDYKHKVQDFTALAAWCRSRRGQVIVCEADGADWLPFAPLRKPVGSGQSRRREVVWVGGT